jgi:hypothetical protein
METDPSGNFSVKDLLPHSIGGWIGLGVSTIAGGVLGGLSAKFIWALASGAITSAGGTAVQMVVDGKGFDKTKLAISAIEGALVAGLFYGAGKVIAYFKKRTNNVAAHNTVSRKSSVTSKSSLADSNNDLFAFVDKVDTDKYLKSFKPSRLKELEYDYEKVIKKMGTKEYNKIVEAISKSKYFEEHEKKIALDNLTGILNKKSPNNTLFHFYYKDDNLIPKGYARVLSQK